jgi:hypothetical protein
MAGEAFHVVREIFGEGLFLFLGEGFGGVAGFVGVGLVGGLGGLLGRGRFGVVRFFCIGDGRL